MLLEGLVRYSRAVHPLLLGEFLDPICWIVLCTTCTLVRPLLFLGNSCSLFIFRETLFLLCMPSLLPLLGPFSPLYLECLLCASSAPSFCRRNFVVFFAHFSQGTFLEHHWSPSSILQSGRSLFCWMPFSLLLYSRHLFRGPLYQSSSIYAPACWSYLLDAFPWFAHLLRTSSQSYYFVVPLHLRPSLLELSSRRISLFCPLALGITCLVLRQSLRVIFSAFVVRPKTDLSCLSRVRHNLSSFSF